VNLDTAKIVTAKISNKRETGRGLHGRARSRSWWTSSTEAVTGRSLAVAVGR
jgi:hypothetical protein